MLQIIRWLELKKLLNISRSTIDRWENVNSFPKRIVLGKNSIGWDRQEVKKWLQKIKKDKTRITLMAEKKSKKNIKK